MPRDLERDMENRTADEIVRALQMQALEPEGGYWRPVYRSQLADGNGQCACGSILYLVTPDSFSHFHKLTVDEIFHFCSGDPVEQIILKPDGTMHMVVLGADPVGKGHQPVSVVPAGCWQAARLLEGGRHALLAATTVPGYTDQCVTHCAAQKLATEHPAFAGEIMRFADGPIAGQ